MRLLLTIAAVVLNSLGIIVMLLVIAFGHMVLDGVVVATVCAGIAALNIVAVLFGARVGGRKVDLQDTARTFD